MIRIRLDGGIHHVLHRRPQSLDLIVGQHPSRGCRVHSGKMKDLVRHPVADAGAEGLVHDETLDRRARTCAKESRELF